MARSIECLVSATAFFLLSLHVESSVDARAGPRPASVMKCATLSASRTRRLGRVAELRSYTTRRQSSSRVCLVSCRFVWIALFVPLALLAGHECLRHVLHVCLKPTEWRLAPKRPRQNPKSVGKIHVPYMPIRLRTDRHAQSRPSHHSAPPTTPLVELDPNAAISKLHVPEPATSQTTKKPKMPRSARRDAKGLPPPQAGLVDKENAGGGDEHDTARRPDADRVMGPPSSTSRSPAKPVTSSEPIANTTSKTPLMPHANTFPSTPGARLQLEDLIGNFDETVQRSEAINPSPGEQLGWVQNHATTPNRKRKRARSSSPSCPTTSSQRHETSNFFPANASQGEKKTPDMDPSADLWQRYGVVKGTGDGLKIPDFSHLMLQASPRPLETPVKNAGLRRWASTGNDWPSSKTKRRRGAGSGVSSAWRGHEATDSNRKSAVASMVEKMQESLATQKLARVILEPAVCVDGPSSSSPLPEVSNAAFGDAPSASPVQIMISEPTRQVQPAPRQAPSTALTQTKWTAPKAVLPIVDFLPKAAATSEVLSPTPLHLQSKAPLPAYKRPAISRVQSTSGRQYPSKHPVPPPVPVPVPVISLEDLEDFGDAFDLSVEDMDELVSQVPLEQRPLHAIPEHPDPPPPDTTLYDWDMTEVQPEVANQQLTNNAVVIDDSNDDEFGDDGIDEDSFARAEFSATQRFMASNPSVHTAR